MLMKLSPQKIKEFQTIIWNFYKHQGRHDMPWRHTTDPYCIVVSEIMLQQTQVERVGKYYAEFLRQFPSWQILAKAPVKKVLSVWQGLGYNRRALFLQRAAQEVVKNHNGKLPKTIDEMVKLPGIGTNTAGAVLAYSYNLPVVYIETNIRRIFIHHFFKQKTAVNDRDIMPLVEQTLPKNKSREWYWALMDYGSTIPKTVANPNRNSKHYTKQSAFEGSRRQLRARIVKLLLEKPLTLQQLSKEIQKPELENILQDLTTEGFIKKQKNIFTI